MNSLISKIAKKDFDLPGMVELVIRDKTIRDEVVSLMISHADIMVYYHCFYILELAIARQPEIFYPYWGKIVGLLDHANSYQRDFALTLIAGLVEVDRDQRFDEIERKYLSLLNDQKFCTALCCLRSLTWIVKDKPALLPKVVMSLLHHGEKTPYLPKQEALFNADVLILLGQNYSKNNIPPAVIAFIERQRTSESPKTRRLAKALFTDPFTP